MRVHPVVGLDGKPNPGLGRLRRTLSALGIRSLLTTNYEFFAGTRQTLVLEGQS